MRKEEPQQGKEQGLGALEVQQGPLSPFPKLQVLSP